MSTAIENEELPERIKHNLSPIRKRYEMAVKHEGFHAHRLENNPLEKLYASEWAKMAPHNFGHLMDTDTYSARDAKVAATMIQWLGSPVGQDFVDSVLRKYRRQP